MVDQRSVITLPVLLLSDFEASLLRLLEKISNGCIIKISPTGTSMKYVPGMLTGGEFTHDCPVTTLYT